MNKPKVWDFKIVIFALIAISWFVLGFLCIFQDIAQNYKGYFLVMRLSLEGKRAVTTGEEFYRFIKLCDNFIPRNQDVEWVLPAGNYLGNNEYYFYKAYYFLYPRDYRTTADYIMVYNRPEYKIPSGYKLIAEFGPGQYILAKSK